MLSFYDSMNNITSAKTKFNWTCVHYGKYLAMKPNLRPTEENMWS
jgi:hypothetical protein